MLYGMGGLVALLCLVLLTPSATSAERLRREDVPGPLVPWIDWVLRDVPDAGCPFVHANATRRQCVWPARLELELGERGGRFEQTWRSYRPARVPLPGDQRHWPEDVRVDGAPVAVVARDGIPSISLTAGRHRVSGAFSFPSLPEALPIPDETGLVRLELLGEPVPFPERDPAGRLWLRRASGLEDTPSRLDVIVHRRVVDEVPLLLETRVELRVAGAARETRIGPAVLEGFVPLSLDAPLPTRVEGDGSLRVQLRPGTWNLRLLARHSGGPALGIRVDGPQPAPVAWAGEEVWVFDARPAIRVVEVEGAPAIDPQQTRLPAEWRHLPAYLVELPGELRLVPRRRGDPEPAPDQLSLSRTLWLDFDGGGYTVHDRLEGTLSRSWRLGVAPPLRPGRVAIDGQDQFLSRLHDDDPGGVEVRQGRIALEADSRIDGKRGRIPAIGWAHDLQSVSGQLNLPPGWRLIHASGVDDVRTTWVGAWSLLEIFLVILTGLAVGQLHGRGFGALALATLALTYTEPAAPRFVWLVPLAASALLRVLPEGRLRRAAGAAHAVALLALVLTAIPFAIGQVRAALYPALELPHLRVDGESARRSRVVAGEAPFEQEALLESGVASLEDRAGRLDRPRVLAKSPPAQSHYYAPDPTALVSTGPGLPNWAWHTIGFSWRGPVSKEQQVGLILAPPWLNFLLAWLRVALLGLLLWCVIGRPGIGRLLPVRSGATALLALGLASAPTSLPAADLPPKELLDQLRERLLEPPDCFPHCASSPRLRLEADANALRLLVRIDTTAATAVPLPGGLGHWEPEQILLAGDPVHELARSPDGTLWIPLPPGRHQLLLAGVLPDREVVSLPLPLRPHRVEVGPLHGWQLDGVREGEVDSSLQLTRRRDSREDPTAEPGAHDPGELPPFVRIERTLRLGLSWQVETRVVRVSPPGRALFLEIPLIDGEAPTTDAIEVDGARARVQLAPNASHVTWGSVLEHSPRLTLEASADGSWTELWTVDASPIWHVEARGIPPLHSGQIPPIRTRSFQPWPGEGLTLEVTRPGALDGRSLTIDRVSLGVRPGLRGSEAELALWLRASRGLRHTITLPEGSQLSSVEIDGVRQPLQADQRQVVLPIRPGAQRADVRWRSDVAISPLYRTPSIELASPSVNTEIEVAVPRDRWVLLAGGPRLGPAVLFWSLLIVAALLAAALGRVPLTRLGWASWLLLFVGLTQVPVWAAAVVVGWLLLLGWRRDNARLAASAAAFDALQLAVVLTTAGALLVLILAVRQGLLGEPDMQIRGNGSTGFQLRWYADRSDPGLPTAWLVSVPLLVYRVAMLAWALWLAGALIGWLRFGWDSFSTDGLWRPLRRPRVPSPAEPEAS